MRKAVSTSFAVACLAAVSNGFVPAANVHKLSRTAVSMNTNDIEEGPVDRREAIRSFLGGAAFVAISSVGGAQEANALDMDAFANAQLAADTENCDPKRDSKCIEKLTDDEALCKYGQGGGKARTEACKRVRAAGGKLPGSDPKVKSLGGAYAM
uniref:Uncharacterized protein n=1 Tax=Helicotheca tamesis TaxID=374047 RepID=A0A7S2E299_9STRA|mmetsp:Transcript_11920/g.16474  ORF Transcript_11920/g.16474 Transcript_11920/m.16474 type:complete len:154 (+) Transcript_11920:124-585(+)|eukprot:CAMPEP_0185729164 /NCGR_PEP_ID=MMETSP1171-20130828/4501_1 /TAXON_ID=374046 /ORGANISM="Helicotheca tamensis, Strain CCMP826" /LENGTH=153 /DNA_ID=CAMNT_0028397941 /DNA_START=104 /DNA_END=565 /DNA_ORIENTATION=+